MPKYRAIARGYHSDNRIYDPESPDKSRHFVVTDKPLKPVPSWLEPVTETAKAAGGKGKKGGKTTQKDSTAPGGTEGQQSEGGESFIDGKPGSAVTTL